MMSLGKCVSFLFISLLVFLAAAEEPSPGSPGRRIYVSLSGNDLTAVPNDATRAFQTLPAAFSILQSNDQLLIGPGRHTVLPGWPLGILDQPDFAPLKLTGLTNVTISGVGDAEIYGEGAGDFLKIEGCSNITIENLTWRGNRAPVPNIPVADGVIIIYSMIYFRGENQGATIAGCKFLSFGNHAISCIFTPMNSRDINVVGCYFADGGDGDVQPSPPLGKVDGAAISGIGPGWLIASNTVERCYFGFEIEGSRGFPLKDITIRDNLITNCYTVGIMLIGTGNVPEEYQNISILNNRIAHIAHNPNTPPSSLCGIWISAGQNLRVMGNHISDMPLASAILLNSSFLPLSNAVVSHNIVDDAYVGIGIFQQGANTLKNVSVLDNEVSNSFSAIQVNGDSISIERNHLWNDYPNLIYVDFFDLGSDSISIIDNKLETTILPEYGIDISPGAANVIMTGNEFVGFVDYQVNDLGFNSLSIPKIRLMKNDLGTSMRLFGAPGKSYSLQSRGDLTSTVSEWKKVYEFTSGPQGYTLTPNRILKDGFFRIMENK